MALISKKKKVYSISEALRAYLAHHNREIPLPIRYKDLLRYDNTIPLIDKNGKDTLWESVFYPQDDMKQIYHSLKAIYALLKSRW